MKVQTFSLSAQQSFCCQCNPSAMVKACFQNSTFQEGQTPAAVAVCHRTWIGTTDECGSGRPSAFSSPESRGGSPPAAAVASSCQHETGPESCGGCLNAAVSCLGARGEASPSSASWLSATHHPTLSIAVHDMLLDAHPSKGLHHTALELRHLCTHLDRHQSVHACRPRCQS